MLASTVMPRPALRLRKSAAASEADTGAPSQSGRIGRTDAELVASALRGERAAEDRLYREHAPAVGAVIARLMGRTADAEDVLQDSFVSAFSRLSQLREPSRFRPWLVRIAVHQAHRRFRRRKLLATLGLDRGHDDASMSALYAGAPESETRAELTRLDRALKQLRTDERMAWMLRHVEGYELTEVAHACGVSLATCKRKLARAQALIAEHARLDMDMDVEEPIEDESIELLDDESEGSHG